eukprot:6252608-Prymnesium_polylepis.1
MSSRYWYHSSAWSRCGRRMWPCMCPRVCTCTRITLYLSNEATAVNLYLALVCSINAVGTRHETVAVRPRSRRNLIRVK